MIAILLAALAQAPSSPPIEGRWKSPGGNSIIDIAKCGDDWCGTVAWASAKAKKDASKATDQLVGTKLLTSLEQKREGRWQGQLFVPDKNIRATAKIELAKTGQLKVSGCLAGKALCKAELWTRLDGPLPPPE